MFKELIKAMVINGGKAAYGAINKKIKNHTNRFEEVVKQKLFKAESALLGTSILTTSSNAEGVIFKVPECDCY